MVQAACNPQSGPNFLQCGRRRKWSKRANSAQIVGRADFGSWSMELSELTLFETRSEFFSLSKNYRGSLLERIKHQDAITTVHLLSLFAPFAFPAEPTLTTGASRTVGYKPPAL
jgi:hypothetical protein